MRGTGRGSGAALRRGALIAMMTASGVLLATPASAAIGRRSAAARESEPQALIPHDPMQGGRFGQAIAASGKTLVIGSAANGSGGVYVFNKTASGWTERQELTPTTTGTPGDFGTSVAISGSAIVVGDPMHRQGSVETGAVYVFEKQGKHWVQTAELTITTKRPVEYGGSVAVSGSSILVGASRAKAARSLAGLVYAYADGDEGWQQESVLSASDSAHAANFGTSISIDGSTAVIGAPNAAGHGVAYVFANTGAAWVQQAELTASNATRGDTFGDSTAISGGHLVIGAPSHGAYLFTGAGSTWVQQTELTVSGLGPNDFFAAVVAIDGTRVAVGAPNASATSPGAAYEFEPVGAVWNETPLVQGDGAKGDIFGAALAFAGKSILVGAPLHAVEGKLSAGAAYVFAP